MSVKLLHLMRGINKVEVRDRLTTLVALNTKDGVVLGCDSLATVTRRMVDPFALGAFFEQSAQGAFTELSKDPNGEPVLDFAKLYQQSQEIPYNHMTLVDKLFSLAPLDIGVMYTGISSIGDRTIKNIIQEFKDSQLQGEDSQSNYTVSDIGSMLLTTLRNHYVQAYSSFLQPELELMVGGYDAQVQTPCIVRLNVKRNQVGCPNYDLVAHFGAQRSEIARLVFGTDAANRNRIETRHAMILENYRTSLQSHLAANQINVELPGITDLAGDFAIFSEGWALEGLDAPWGEFSVQNAIDCVDFLVNIMIRSHQFKSQMPSVAGPVQIGVIQKNQGFTYVSERLWRHGGNVTQIKED